MSLLRKDNATFYVSIATLEIDPTFKVVFAHLLDDYIKANDLVAYQQLLSRYRKEDPADGAVKAGEGRLLLAQRDFEDAIRRIEEDVALGYMVPPLARATTHLGLANWDRAEAWSEEHIRTSTGYRIGHGYRSRGRARIAKGKLRSGLGDLEEAAARFKDPWLKRQVSLIHETRAAVLMEAGDLDGALKAAKSAVAADPFYGGAYHTQGYILASSGRARELEELLTRLIEMSEQSFSPPTGFWVRLLSAEKHLATGDVTRARLEVEAAAAMPPEHRDRRRESLVLARVLAAAGDRSGAIAAYREFLEPPYLNLTGQWVEQISVLYPLARLEEEEGELASAREHYQKYLASWGNADMPIVNVPDAKARLERLEAAAG